jgi:hypothetical protein
MTLIHRIKSGPMPLSLESPEDIKEARELYRLGYIEARFAEPSKCRDSYWAERGAVVLRVTAAGLAAWGKAGM